MPSYRGFSLALAFILFFACASPAPQPAGLPPAAEPAAPPPFPDAAMVCGEGSRSLSWSDLGVPEGYAPRDLALSADSAWILLQPSTLVRVPRQGSAETSFVTPKTDEEWSAVDVDPQDGTLWIALRQSYRLLHLTPDGEGRRVSLTRVAGEGGLVDVRVGRDVLHTQPFCADHALWTVERDGEMVIAAFRAAEALEDAGSQGAIFLEQACPKVHAARGPDDEVVVFDPVTVQLHRAHGARTWEAFQGPFGLVPPGRYTDPARLRVATLPQETIPASEAPRYLPDLVRGLFYLGGEPHLLGSVVHGPPRGDDSLGRQDPIGTVLYRVDEGVLTPRFESCGGAPLLRIETDAHGLAALTTEGLVLGSATAAGG